MAVLILDEFESPPVRAEGLDCPGPVRQNHGVVQNRRHRFQADVHFDGVAVGRLHRAKRRRNEARDRAFVRQAIGERDERPPAAPVRHEHRHSARADAAVTGPREQR